MEFGMRGQMAANAIGNNVDYDEIQRIEDALIRARQRLICCVACILIPIYVVIILIIEVNRRGSGSHKCGIPVQIWVELFFVIPLIYLLLLLNELWIIRCNRTCLKWYGTITLILVFLAFLIYYIWGWIMYYDDDNNCQDYPDTSVYLVFMCIILFFSLIFFLFICLIIICAPILYCRYRDSRRRDGKLDGEDQIASVVNRLDRSKFDPSAMPVTTQCIICMEDFKPNDNITQLKCNEGHLFHTDCLIQWITADGNNTCPICRAHIDNLEEFKEMMEGGEHEGLLEDSRNATSSRGSNSPNNHQKNE